MENRAFMNCIMIISLRRIPKCNLGSVAISTLSGPLDGALIAGATFAGPLGKLAIAGCRIGVAAVATVLSVLKIASRQPVDIIREAH